MGTVTDYLATVDAARRPALERVVDRARELVPDLQEGTSYGMPVLLYRGKGLLSAMAATKHLAIYPHSGTPVGVVSPMLAGFSMSPGTVRFTADRPIPDDALDLLILTRRDEIDAQLARKR
ncbi:MAG: DUF1801 domain-containing protein [Actinomycetales bacterium]|nr:DUF1801 domain-containing protein [Actinomycetales bacterium]